MKDKIERIAFWLFLSFMISVIVITFDSGIKARKATRFYKESESASIESTNISSQIIEEISRGDLSLIDSLEKERDRFDVVADSCMMMGKKIEDSALITRVSNFFDNE